jgi:YfiH family protein
MLQRTVHNNGVVTYQSPKLGDCGVRHGFTTRLGGISEGPYASLNLDTLEKSDQSDFNTSVAENFRRVREALGCPKYMRTAVRQVHGGEVWVPPAAPSKPDEAPEADAIVTDQPGKLLTIRIADCVPVLLANDAGTVIAAAHAGWRGLVAGVLSNTLEVMGQRFGASADGVTAAIGPAISVAHFEVGEDVAEQFIRAGLGQAVDRTLGQKPHINLPDAALMQLVDAGLSPSRIDVTDRCTYRDEGEFFSHRRDEGKTGRLAAVIAI